MKWHGAWIFDGTQGRGDILVSLVMRQLSALDALLPEVEDPLESMVAPLGQAAAKAIEQDPGLARLFPPADDDPHQAEQWRQSAAVEQIRARVESGRRVIADITVAETEQVEVAENSFEDWIKTLAGLRASWHAELISSADRLREASSADVARNESAAAICDWLAFLIDDAVSTRSSQFHD